MSRPHSAHPWPTHTEGRSPEELTTGYDVTSRGWTEFLRAGATAQVVGSDSVMEQLTDVGDALFLLATVAESQYQAVLAGETDEGTLNERVAAVDAQNDIVKERLRTLAGSVRQALNSQRKSTSAKTGRFRFPIKRHDGHFEA